MVLMYYGLMGFQVVGHFQFFVSHDNIFNLFLSVAINH